MSREIKRVVSSGDASVAIVQTAGRCGSEFANPAVLRTVQLATLDLERLLDAPKIGGNPLFKTLEVHEVDSRYQGPRSNYAKVLQRMESRLAGRLPQSAPGTPVAVLESPTAGDLSGLVAAQTLCERLSDAAPASRPPRAYGGAAEARPRTSKHRL